MNIASLTYSTRPNPKPNSTQYSSKSGAHQLQNSSRASYLSARYPRTVKRTLQ